MAITKQFGRGFVMFTVLSYCKSTVFLQMYHGYRNTEGRLKLDFHSGYHATLHLSQLQWTDTGFYRCVPKDFDETLQVQNELAFQENRVYIYVSGKVSSLRRSL